VREDSCSTIAWAWAEGDSSTDPVYWVTPGFKLHVGAEVQGYEDVISSLYGGQRKCPDQHEQEVLFRHEDQTAIGV
jgi:hypothetical protein